jgi:hypothetical protein
LHIGQGAPAPPQGQACGPSHGSVGWFSQIQPVSSQRRHFIGSYSTLQNAGSVRFSCIRKKKKIHGEGPDLKNIMIAACRDERCRLFSKRRSPPPGERRWPHFIGSSLESTGSFDSLDAGKAGRHGASLIKGRDRLRL